MSPDMSIEMTNFNPIFSTQGEQSVPITLPASHNNLSLIGFSNRIDNYYKPISEMQVDVVDDVFMRPGRMALHHADNEGISCTIYFNEGSFYSLIDDKVMTDIPLDVIEGLGATKEEKRAYLITLLKNEYRQKTSEVYSVFPVATQKSVTRLIVPFYKNEQRQETFDLVLNGFENNIDFLAAESNKIVVLDRFIAESPQDYFESGVKIPTDKSYGMTAFVNVFYFLNKMFAHLGYAFDDSSIRSHFSNEQWRIVMLNNVADAIYEGKLDLNQLVPELSLKDFMKKIASYFSGSFHVDEFSKKVDFIVYATFFQYRPAADLTQYMSSPLRIQSLSFVDYELVNTRANQNKSVKNAIEIDLPLFIQYPFIAQGMEPESPSGGNAVEGIIGFTRQTAPFPFMNVGDVVHKNSTIIKDGKVEESKSDASKELILCGVSVANLRAVDVALRFVNRGNPPIYTTFKFNSGYDSIFFTDKSAIDFLKEKYAPYTNFHKNSNMEISCEVHLPPSVLYTLDLSKQYLFEETLFFIDKINYTLPYDGKQKLTLRPFKTYADR